MKTWPCTNSGVATPTTADRSIRAGPQRFGTTLPNSPLSYEGHLIKLRWCVRVRVFPHRGKEVVEEKAFQLVEGR